MNGTGTHFWLNEGIMTPLLTSGDIMLSGKTFSRPNPNPALDPALTLTLTPNLQSPTPTLTLTPNPQS